MRDIRSTRTLSKVWQMSVCKTKLMAGVLAALREACISEKSECESMFEIGARGICNNETGLCVCPEGFSGQDDWSLTNDCRTNENSQLILWQVGLGLSSFMFVACLLIMFAILRRGELFSFENSKKTHKSSMNDVLKGRKSRKHLVRRRWTLIALFLGSTFSFGQILYYSRFLQGFRRFEIDLLQDIGLWLTVSSMTGSQWAFAAIFYLNLPSLSKFRVLLNIDSILFRHPTLVKRSTIARIVLAFAVNFILLVIINQSLGEELDSHELLDTVFLVWFTLCLVDFLIFIVTLELLLRKLFIIVRDSKGHMMGAADPSTVSESKNSTDSAAHAIRTIDRTLVVLLMLFPINIVTLVATIFTPALRTRMHIVFNVLLLSGNFGLLFMLFIITLRLVRNETMRDRFSSKQITSL